jgi:hypothetical protein
MPVALSALLCAAPCELPGAEGLSDAQARALCALEVEAPATSGASLAAIYARPGFERARRPEASDVLRRLRAWLEAIFETAGAESYSNVTRVVVLVAAALGAIAAVVRLGRRGARPTATAPGTPAEAGLELANPLEHLARARDALSSAPRMAAREGLLAILSALERQRLARPDRVKTNREIVSELPGRGAPGPIVEAVRAQLGWFDRAWYSAAPLDAEAAGRFLDAAQGLVAQLARLGPEPGP